MGVEDAISSLGTQALTVNRYAPETVVNGQRVRGAMSTITIQGLIQPLQPDEVNYLPEGVSSQGTFKLYTADTIRTADDLNRTQSDEVLYNGRKYEVKAVEAWGAYSKALITEVRV